AGQMPWKSRRRLMRTAGNDNDVWDADAVDAENIVDISQVEGSAYLSSPFCFEHGVRYESSRDDPVMALQFRFAFLNETEAQLVNGLRDGAMREIASVFAEAIAASVAASELRMPDVAEVAAREAEESSCNQQPDLVAARLKGLRSRSLRHLCLQVLVLIRSADRRLPRPRRKTLHE
ncbi:unnamed protein product, partial [Polarella glacialis]